MFISRGSMMMIMMIASRVLCWHCLTWIHFPKLLTTTVCLLCFLTVTVPVECRVHYLLCSTRWQDGWSITKNNKGSKRYDIKGEYCECGYLQSSAKWSAWSHFLSHVSMHSNAMQSRILSWQFCLSIMYWYGVKMTTGKPIIKAVNAV